MQGIKREIYCTYLCRPAALCLTDENAYNTLRTCESQQQNKATQSQKSALALSIHRLAKRNLLLLPRWAGMDGLVEGTVE